MSDASYEFLAWVRRGSAAAIRATDRDGAALTARASMSVGVDVNDRRVADRPITILGPGDVAGIDTSQIVRTEPIRTSTDFEPNYFAFIEFDEPAFPWLFTPASADPATGRLRPWCVLVVVEQQDGVSIRGHPDLPLPQIRITGPARPALELADLAESWAWAHAQVILPPAGDARAALEGEPLLTLSRLMCPRQLRPMRSYIACVVPAFSAGVAAGRGERVDSAAPLEPAWRSGADAPATVELPLYFSWEFATGPAGDFETLVRRLEPRALPPGVGRRPMFVGDGGLDLPVLAPETPGVVVGREGALRRAEATSQPLDAAVGGPLAAALEGLINAATRRRLGEDADPRIALSAPLYGRWAAQQHRVASTSPVWLRELNLDPRSRVAAGAGTRAVQLDQESLVREAWEQAGAVEKANRLLLSMRFARSVARRVYRKHYLSLDTGQLLFVTGPAHARLVGAAETVATRLRRSPLPAAVTSTRFRRQRRPTSRAQTIALSFAASPEPLVRSVNDGTLRFGAAEAAPDGAIAAAQLEEVTAETGEVQLPSAGGFRVSAALFRALREVGPPGRAPAIDVSDLMTATAPAGFTVVREVNVLGTIAAGLADVTPVLHVQPPAPAPPPVPVATPVTSVTPATSVTPSNRPGFVTVRTASEPVVAVAVGGAAPAPAPRAAPTARGETTDLADTVRNAVGATRPTFVTARPRAGELFDIGGGLEVEFVTDLDVTRPPVGEVPDVIIDSVVAPAVTVRLPNAVPGRPSTTRPDAGAAARFRTAAAEYLVGLSPDVEPAPVVPPLPLPTVRAELLATLRPEQRLELRASAHIAVGPDALRPPDSLGSMSVAPAFTRPVYKMVERVDPDFLLPGLEQVPPDTIALVETNPAFVEALMTGANHEMARELTWRGYPTERRATFLRHFWDRADGTADIPPIHAWTADASLGQSSAGDPGGQSVILIRGELLRRYPGALVYLSRASRAADGGRRFVADAETTSPAFQGSIDPDVGFFGFPLSVEALLGAAGSTGDAGWFVVIQQQPTEPRFGLDHDDRFRPDLPAVWRDLTWGHLSAGGDPGAVRFATVDALPAGTQRAGLTWGRDSAHMAGITFQDPVRIVVHARRLLGDDGAEA